MKNEADGGLTEGPRQPGGEVQRGREEVGSLEATGDRSEPGQGGYESSVRERHGERVRDRKRKSDILLQTLLDVGRGVLIGGFGLFFFDCTEAGL